MFWGCFVSSYVVRAFTLLKEGLAEAFPNGGELQRQSRWSDFDIFSKNSELKQVWLLFFWKNKSPNRALSLRRERDSNPRRCYPQRSSRPPQSTTLPSLRGQKYKSFLILQPSPAISPILAEIDGWLPTILPDANRPAPPRKCCCRPF